jgi:hypothetical protein
MEPNYWLSIIGQKFGRSRPLSYRRVAPKRYKRRAVIICMRIVSSGIDSNSVANRVDASGEGFLAFWRRTIIYKNGHVRRFESEREAWAFLERCDEAGKILHEV